MREKDAIEKLKEWQEHQYNPGYWINRFSLGFPPKRTKRIWILALIDLIVAIPTAIMGIGVSFSLKNISVYLYTVFAIILLGLAILRAIRLKPGPKPEKNQAEIDKLRHAENAERKRKLANRRKDFH